MELIKFPFPCLFVFSDKERDEVISVLIVYILKTIKLESLNFSHSLIKSLQYFYFIKFVPKVTIQGCSDESTPNT